MSARSIHNYPEAGRTRTEALSMYLGSWASGLELQATEWKLPYYIDSPSKLGDVQGMTGDLSLDRSHSWLLIYVGI